MRPDREATTGVNHVRRHAEDDAAANAAEADEARWSPEAEFSSYYGTADRQGAHLGAHWTSPATSSSAASPAPPRRSPPAPQLSGRPALARPLKLGAAGAISLSLVALVHDLGRPARFLNMLRVFKPTSPMSVGVWILSAYAPAAGAAALGELRATASSARTRRNRRGGAARAGGRLLHRRADRQHRHARLARGAPRDALRVRRLGRERRCRARPARAPGRAERARATASR